MSGYDQLKIEDNSKFLKVKAGQTATIHIVTKSEDIKTSFIHWNNNKRFDCNNGPTCVLCKDGVKKQQRFTINVIDRSDGKTKEFSFGPEVAGQLKKNAQTLRMDDMTVHDIDFNIICANDEGRTKYTVIPRIGKKAVTNEEAGTAIEPELSQHHDEDGNPL